MVVACELRASRLRIGKIFWGTKVSTSLRITRSPSFQSAAAEKACGGTLELDPLNLMIGTWVGRRYYLARKYELAIEQARNAVELDANFAAAHLLLGENYVQAGLHEQGLAELQTAAGLSGNSPLYMAQVAVADALAERKPEALQVVAQLQTISSTRYVSPYGFAQIYAALNDKGQTFKWLQIAYNDRAVDPVFDSLRSDQRCEPQPILELDQAFITFQQRH